MKIIQPHWCPQCRVMYDEWTVKGSKAKKKLKPGDPWPKLEPVRTEAVNKCDSCGHKIKGQIIVIIDENGEPEKLSYVKEIN